MALITPRAHTTALAHRSCFFRLSEEGREVAPSAVTGKDACHCACARTWHARVRSTSSKWSSDRIGARPSAANPDPAPRPVPAALAAGSTPALTDAAAGSGGDEKGGRVASRAGPASCNSRRCSLRPDEAAGAAVRPKHGTSQAASHSRARAHTHRTQHTPSRLCQVGGHSLQARKQEGTEVEADTAAAAAEAAAAVGGQRGRSINGAAKAVLGGLGGRVRRGTRNRAGREGGACQRAGNRSSASSRDCSCPGACTPGGTPCGGGGGSTEPAVAITAAAAPCEECSSASGGTDSHSRRANPPAAAAAAAGSGSGGGCGGKGESEGRRTGGTRLCASLCGRCSAVASDGEE